MFSIRTAVRNISIILCVILVFAAAVLLTASLMQEESSLSLGNPDLLPGTVPVFFIAGRFDNRTKRQRMKDHKDAAGCMFSGIGLIFTFPFLLIIWMFKIIAWPFKIFFKK